MDLFFEQLGQLLVHRKFSAQRNFHGPFPLSVAISGVVLSSGPIGARLDGTFSIPQNILEKKKKRPAAPSVATLIKADEKFGKPHPEEKFSRAAGKDVRKSALKPLSKKKRPPLPPLKGHVPGADKVFVENGIEVVVKKPRLHLPETAKAAAASKTAISKKREQGKFSRKKNKGTRYEPYSFKRKADGSFKKKSPQKK